MEYIIEAHQLTKTYTQGKIQIKALAGVDLMIKPGEFTVLAGPSGSGKTTLLNILGGLDLPSSGKISFNSQDLAKLSQGQLANLRLNNIGFVFQAYNIIPVLTAIENVEYILLLQGLEKKKRFEQAKQILDEVGLDGLYHRKPAELSGGQQQRIAVARAIVSKPSLILADEPTANLDSKTGESLIEIMLKMNKNYQTTFIFSTHDQMVMSYAKRMINLKDGLIIKD